jgi:hypothetical protein
MPAVVGTFLLWLLGLMPLRSAAGQAQATPPPEAPTARVALLPVALYTAQANVQQVSDSNKASLATQVLADRLQELLADRLVPRDSAAGAAESQEARAASGDQPCNVIVACARLVGRRLGAPWVVMAKVSKTSNLIWLFTGQLIHVGSGKIVLDDSTELKGDPDTMVKAGARIFAERVARTVKQGGVATDYPTTQ